jgi:hypothetical protein
MVPTIFGEAKLMVNNKEIVGHHLNPPFAELIEVQQRQNSTPGGKKSYQRVVGRLDASWQATFAQLEADMKQGTLIAEDALDFDDLSAADLLDLSLLGGQSWYKAVMVETQGLEPWTPCLQSRCSSQLSYVPLTSWWAMRDLNLRPRHYQ